MATRKTVLVPARRTPTSFKKLPTVGVTPTPPLGGSGGGSLPDKTADQAKQLQEALLALPEEQRKQILDNVLAAQMLAAPEKDRALQLWTDAVAEVFIKSLGGPGLAGYGPMVVKQALATRAAYMPVKRLVSALGLGDLAPAQQMSAYTLLAEMLVRYARASKAPMTPKLLANCCQNLVAVYEGEFPGYLESGMGLLPFRMRFAGMQTDKGWE